MPDVIVLDLLMPVLNGFAFLEKFNADALLKHIPVIILTNLTELEKTKLPLDASKDYFFTKTNHTLDDIVAQAKKVCLENYSKKIRT